MLEETYKDDKEIYFKRQTLIHSPEDRVIDLLTISSYDMISKEKEKIVDMNLFPKRKTE